jgi:hypothetical protein
MLPDYTVKSLQRDPLLQLTHQLFGSSFNSFVILLILSCIRLIIKVVEIIVDEFYVSQVLLCNWFLPKDWFLVPHTNKAKAYLLASKPPYVLEAYP